MSLWNFFSDCLFLFLSEYFALFKFVWIGSHRDAWHAFRCRSNTNMNTWWSCLLADCWRQISEDSLCGSFSPSFVREGSPWCRWRDTEEKCVPGMPRLRCARPDSSLDAICAAAARGTKPTRGGRTQHNWRADRRSWKIYLYGLEQVWSH